MEGEELMQGDVQRLNDLDERIHVSVRLRPLNERELVRNDLLDWECISNTTILFKNTVPERALVPTAYTFDRVFGWDSTTKQVYEEGAKEVALSVVNGINSTIFAYGQTSSGKTYTMNGVTEYSVADIYNYIKKHQDREFVLKFSALEIYNESVRDLLNLDHVPLRLLDDPEKGTVVEKLTEETLRDRSHLQELLSFCQVQRKIGETALNETSSRSHQILKLTIESVARKYMKSGNSSSLMASVNFVDLAGSERTSQTTSTGARHKEGCHINRSLLTLGTVIRKLSKGKNGHIPYRDSKLTRILQNSLGGNARTAIICTMSPAHSHVEQSRNTLLFATCAKEVNTNAQVNVLMSDKALVKQLQRELARLENEIKSLALVSIKGNSTVLLKEKELLIEKMDNEIKELTQQRDLAQYRVENLLHSIREDQAESSLQTEPDQVDLHCTSDSDLKTLDTFQNFDEREEDSPHNVDSLFTLSNEDNFLLDDSTLELTGPDPYHDWEEIAQRAHANSEDGCKDVQCIESEESNQKLNREGGLSLVSLEEDEGKEASTIGIIDQLTPPLKENKEFYTFNTDYNYDEFMESSEKMQKPLNCIINLYPAEQSLSSIVAAKARYENMKLARSRSSLTVLMTIPPSTLIEKAERDKKIQRGGSDINFSIKKERSQRRRGLSCENLAMTGSQLSVSSHCRAASCLEMIDEDDNTSVLNFSTGHSVKARTRLKRQSTNSSELGWNSNTDEYRETMEESRDSEHGSWPYSSWFLEFQRQQRHIIELWDACNEPLVHRSYFFILFKGDPSDRVYMEVEVRRLSFIKEAFSHRIYTMGRNDSCSKVSSLRALNRERETLSKRVKKRFSMRERKGLYQKWGIELKTKQRSQQLARRIWSNTEDLEHIRESATLVAKLIGFLEHSEVPREMFGVTVPQTLYQRSLSRKGASPFLAKLALF